jgi:dihydroorotate dehydrogenase (NAD+) catalytic subunit
VKLRGVEFGHVFNASGARGFFGEGYWYHPLAWPFGLDYEGSTFVAKTTTLGARAGNMALTDKWRPYALIPDCIVVKPLKGVVLNAVGLSGPGCTALVKEWLKESSPGQFVISVMSVASTPKERLQEAKAMFELLRPLVLFQGTSFMALQINFSCPNVGLDTSHLVDEVQATLDESAKLGVSTMIKLNALVPPSVAHRMTQHEGCDALVVSNTIPWGQMPEVIDWKKLFGSDVSPLARYGGGGLSGAPLLTIVSTWIELARHAGIKKAIVAGGGILSKADAGQMLDAGASAIELGSVSILRPWRVRGIIQYVNSRLGD